MQRKAASFGNRSQYEVPAWYCLWSKPRQEHVAAKHLRAVEGIIVFWPRIRYRKATRRGSFWVTEAMFPRYLFAHFTLAEMHRRIRHTLGISGIVQFGHHYPTVEDRALAHLHGHNDGE